MSPSRARGARIRAAIKLELCRGGVRQPPPPPVPGQLHVRGSTRQGRGGCRGLMAFVSSAGMCPPWSLTYELPRQDYVHALHPRRASLPG